MNTGKLRQAPTNINYSSSVILGEYKEGIFHGFQKDVIQNALGARENTKSFKGWKCCIYVIYNTKGTFVAVEDFGTCGLTGQNMSYDEILKHSEAGDLPDSERLARIESFFNSGGGKGPGLFGIGKFLYSAMSDDKHPLYYFETNTANEGYRANVYSSGNWEYPADEEGAARQLISGDTGCTPITHRGTRFIIANPKPQIVEMIENGTLAQYAAETWWRLFEYIPDEEDGIFINGKKVTCPEPFTAHVEPANFFISSREEWYKPNFLIQRFGLFVLKEPIENKSLRGICFYRKYMKIFEVACDLIPENLRDRVYGYIEVDGNWRDLMEKAESLSHYGIKQGMQNSTQFTNLKDCVREKVSYYLRQWGYIQDNKRSSRFGSDFDDLLKEQVQDALEDLNYQPLGHGDEPEKVSLRLKNIVFPHPEEERTVYDDDAISFDYTVKNLASNGKDIVINFKTYCTEPAKHELWSDDINIEVEPSASLTQSFKIKISPENSDKNLANVLEISLHYKDGKKSLATRKIVYYYATPTLKDPAQDFTFYCKHIGWPKIGSKRIDTDEQISDLSFYVANNTSLLVPMLLTISIHNAEDRNAKIEALPPQRFVLKPGEDLVTKPVDILFAHEKYLQFLSKGRIEVRSRLSVDGNVRPYNNQDLIGKFFFTVYFNSNNKNGSADAFAVHSVEQPNDQRASWLEHEDGKWVIYVNLAYPELDELDDDGQARFALKEAMFQAQIMYIREGVFDQYKEGDTTFNDKDPGEVIVAAKKASDIAWWKQCQK